MSTYRNTCNKCGSVTETESWEPDDCPFCELDFIRDILVAISGFDCSGDSLKDVIDEVYGKGTWKRMTGV